MDILRKLRAFQFSVSRRILFSWITPTYINNNAEALDIEAGDIVCYVLPFRSSTDIQVANEACRVNGLPELVKPMADEIEPRSFFFLGHPEGTLGRKTLRQQSVRMTRLFEHQQEISSSVDWYSTNANKAGRIKIAPISIFWGHQPDREQSIFKLFLSENWVTTSGFKKFLALLFHPSHILVKFGRPIDLQELMATEEDRNRQVRKLLRLLRVHFNQERQAIIGPDLSHRRTLIDTVLQGQGVRDAINKEAQLTGQNVQLIEKKAFGYIQEIASDQSYRIIRFFDSLLTWLWNKLYNGIEVNDIDKVRQLGQSHELVYTPCHRSHIDYLLLSYLLYHNGLTPPHIAAGNNLDLPLIGTLLRRAGAFYMRRSFRGDNLYKEIFDEYLHQMFTRGYSVEYFIEGGRSRTGRTLPPRTGMLSMTVRSFLKSSEKPIAMLPVYFGYERVLESSTYKSELSGTGKKTESFFDIFSIFSFFKHNFGKVTVNFGEPVLLREFLDEALPNWMDAEKTDIGPACNLLAEKLATQINNAVAIKSTNLVSLALLSTERQSISETQLVTQVELLRNIAVSTTQNSDITIVAAPAEEVIEEAVSIMGLSREEHPFGQIISADPGQSISMTYNANNAIHVFALPSLVCRYIRTRKRASAAQLTEYISLLYPYIKSEMFLPWEPEQLPDVVDGITSRLLELEIIGKRTEFTAPSPMSFSYSCLTNLATITAATLERFYIVIAVLNNKPDISQKELEVTSGAIAAQLSVLYGINSPDFFEKSLFSSFVTTLKSMDGNMALAATRLEPVVATTMNPDIRHNILQAVSAKPD